MGTAVNTPKIEVEVILSEKHDDQSNAKVEVQYDKDDVWLSNSFSVNAGADIDSNGNPQVWLSMREHTYTSFGYREEEPTISRGFDIMGRTFTKEEAEAIVAVLSHELKKFGY